MKIVIYFENECVSENVLSKWKHKMIIVTIKKKNTNNKCELINEHTNSREQRYTTYRWCILHRIVNLSLIFVMRHTTRIHFVIETNWHTATKKNTKDNKNMFRQFNKILVWIGRNWSIKSKCRNQRQLVRLKLINFVVFFLLLEYLWCFGMVLLSKKQLTLTLRLSWWFSASVSSSTPTLRKKQLWKICKCNLVN